MSIGFKISVSGNMSPATVFVTSNNTDRRLDRTWNFNDPTSPYNTTPGRTSAHFYADPKGGSYKITLTEGDQTASQIVHLLPNTRNPMYVRKASDLSGKTIPKNTQICVDADVIVVDVTPTLDGENNIFMSAPGRKIAIIRNSKIIGPIFNTTANATNVVVQGIRFEGFSALSMGPKDPHTGKNLPGQYITTAMGKNFSFVDCEAYALNQGFRFNSWGPAGKEVHITGAFVQDCRANKIQSHPLWLEAQYGVVLGFKTLTGSEDENAMRIAATGLDDGLFYKCDSFAKLKYSFTLRTGNRMDVFDCDFRGYPFQIAPNQNLNFVRDVRVSGCRMHSVHCEVRPNVYQVLFDRNTINTASTPPFIVRTTLDPISDVHQQGEHIGEIEFSDNDCTVVDKSKPVCSIIDGKGDVTTSKDVKHTGNHLNEKVID